MTGTFFEKLHSITEMEEHWELLPFPNNDDIVNALCINYKKPDLQDFRSLFRLYIFFKYRGMSYGNAIVRDGFLEINNRISERDVFKKYSKILDDPNVSSGRFAIDIGIGKFCYKFAMINRNNRGTKPIVEITNEKSIFGNPVHFKINFQMNIELNPAVCDVDPTTKADYRKIITLLNHNDFSLKFTSLEEIELDFKKITCMPDKCRVEKFSFTANEDFSNSIIERRANEFFDCPMVPCSEVIRKTCFISYDGRILIQDGYDIQKKIVVTEVFGADFVTLVKLAAIKSSITEKQVNLHVRSVPGEILNLFEGYNTNLFIHGNSKKYI